MSQLSIIILAAGNGTRMKSATPKVLMTLAGKPLLQHVIDQAIALSPKDLIVVHQESHLNALKNSIQSTKTIQWARQNEQNGTADAVLSGLPFVSGDRVLILYGDVPLTPAQLLTQMVKDCQTCILLTHQHQNPFGFGRIIRNDTGQVIRIVEEKDATEQQKSIQEIFTGIMCIQTTILQTLLPKIQSNNAQNEWYLTDLAELCGTTQALVCDQVMWISGVNTRNQLIDLERQYQRSLAEHYLSQGIHIIDPNRIDIHGTLNCQPDTVIEPNVIIKGQVTIGQHCIIETGVVLEDVSLGNHVHIKAHSIITKTTIKDHATVGPFAHCRPNTSIGEHAKIGNFVEVKNTRLGNHAKASHLSYLGDATIGNSVNIGAGTITCNYDGVQKHQTTIHDHAFIGSQTSLIAPVNIGAHATIGAGSVIVSDAPSNTLTLSRAQQKTIKSWVRKNKQPYEESNQY